MSMLIKVFVWKRNGRVEYSETTLCSVRNICKLVTAVNSAI